MTPRNVIAETLDHLAPREVRIYPYESADDEVAVIRPADQPLTEWEILQQADQIIRGRSGFDGRDSGRLLGLAARLEADARRRALIEKVKASLIETWGQSLPSATYIAADAVDAILTKVGR